MSTPKTISFGRSTTMGMAVMAAVMSLAVSEPIRHRGSRQKRKPPRAAKRSNRDKKQYKLKGVRP